jgi:hypothetical protein
MCWPRPLSSGAGFGFGWAELDPDAEQPTAEIRLRPEQVIQGTLVDVSGRPSAGVEIQVETVFSSDHEDRVAGFNSWGVLLTAGLCAWPRPATTDSQGRFTLAGVGRDLIVSLYVEDIRFARQRIEVETNGEDGPKELLLALQPVVVIEGCVMAADTGQPIPGSVISVRSHHRSGIFNTQSRADAYGHFRINPFPGDLFHLSVAPLGAGPYLTHWNDFTWAKGAVKKEVAVRLTRGVPIQGKVTEDGTGRPVAGASVWIFPMSGSGTVASGEEAIVTSADDGSFQVTVPPGKGHLLVRSPTANYVLRDIGSRVLLSDGAAGGIRLYAHDVVPYEVKADEGSHALESRLKPGKTVRGQLVGPDGQKVKDAAIRSRLSVEPTGLGTMNTASPHAHDGRFELHGLDPERATPACRPESSSDAPQL